MRKNLRDELRRLVGLIPKTDPTTIEYHTLLTSFEALYNLAGPLEEILDELDKEDLADNIVDIKVIPGGVPCSEDCATCDACENAPISSSTSTESVTAGEDPQENVDEVAESESEKVDETYDLVTVRQALIAARKDGVDIKAILKSVGATNLTDLAPEMFGAVMAKLKELT